MINLSCPKCQTVLPVREDKIGKSIFVCPKCAHPLDAGNRAAPVAAWLTEKADPRDPHEATTVGMETAFPDLKAPAPAPTRQGHMDAPTVGPAPELSSFKATPAKPKSMAVEKNVKPARTVAAPGPSSGKPWLTRGRILIAVAAGVVVCALAAGWILWRPAPAPAADELFAALQDDDPAMRAWAVQSIGNLGPKARPLLPLLVNALKDTDPEVRGLAAEALNKRGPANAADLGCLVWRSRTETPRCGLLLSGPWRR